MARSKYNKPKDRRPRKVIYDAQEHCYDWLTACLNVHQGIGTIQPEIARKGLHNAVVRYWIAVNQYRGETKAKRLWQNRELGSDAHPITAGGRRIRSLSDCLYLAFALIEQEQTESDPVEGSTSKREVRSEYLQPRHSMEVMMALNDVVHKLGLGVNIEKKSAGDTPDTDNIPEHIRRMAPAFS